MITAFMRSTEAKATATGTVFGVGQNFAPEASDTARFRNRTTGP